MTHTRQDYLNNKCTHEEYYKQLVTRNTIDTLLNHPTLTIDTLLKSKDEHLNDIPLKIWDNLPLTREIINNLEKLGDYATLAGKVCIYKQTAKVMIQTFKSNVPYYQTEELK